MTTLNHQPAPPPGMPMHLRLATEEDRKGIVPVGAMFAFRNRHYGNASDWMESGNVGFEFASNDHERDYFYAIPITPTVPATGDTDNQPDPPPGMRIWKREEYTTPFPCEPHVFSPPQNKWIESWQHGKGSVVGQNCLHCFFAVPIELGDTTNEKGGEQRQEKCPECGTYRGHSIDCERKTPEEWRVAALLYHQAWLKLKSRDTKWLKQVYERSNKMRALATFWQGKFAILKAENNALRKKLK